MASNFTPYSTSGTVDQSSFLSSISGTPDGTKFLRDDGSWQVPAGGGGGAPTNASYIVVASDGTLSAERVLTGTANQIIVTDNGAGSTLVLSLPQAIHSGANVTFNSLNVGAIAMSGNNNFTHNSAFNIYPGAVGVVPNEDKGYIRLITMNNPTGGSDANQTWITINAYRDSGGSNYFNSILQFCAVDGTNVAAAFEIGTEGNWTNAGGFTVKRLYAWDYARNGGAGGTIWRYEIAQPDRFLIGGDNAEIGLQIDLGKFWARYYADTSVGSGLSFSKYRGTVHSALRRALNGDILGYVNAFGGEAADNSTNASLGGAASGSFRFEALVDHTTTNHWAKAVIATAGSGSTTLTDRLTISDTSITATVPLVAPNGSTASAPLTLGVGGALKTTPAAGDIEADANCFYGTTDAGNRGIFPLYNIIRQDADYTLTSQTAAQKIFNASANGRLTLEVGTYLIDALIHVNTMSATSGNAQFLLLGGGSATLGTQLFHVVGVDGASGTAANQTGSTAQGSSSSPASAVTAGTGTAMTLAVRGTFEVTAAGTIQPQLALVTANAAVVKAGSYFAVTRIGSTTMATVGQWD